MVASTLAVPIQATATTPCFAEVTDSAWADGVPSEVTSKLNYDLVQRIDDPLVDFMDSWQFLLRLVEVNRYDREINYRNLYYVLGGNSYQIKYTYSGKSCTTRVVQIAKSFDKRPDFLPFSETDSIIKSISNDYLDQQEKTKILTNLQKYLDNKTISIAVNSNWTSSGNWWYSKRVLSQYNWQYVTEQLNKLSTTSSSSGASFRIFFKPNESCLAYGSRSKVWNLPKQFKLTGQEVSSSWPVELKFTKKNSKACPVSYFLEFVPFGINTSSPSKYLGPKSDDGFPLSVGFEFANGFFKAVR